MCRFMIQKRASVMGSKLPPRLTGRRERKQHLRYQPQQQSTQQLVTDESATVASAADILPKIENWNNEMANNIPTASSIGITATTQAVRGTGFH